MALLGHNGLDFGTPTGTPILAVDAGTVTRSGYDAGGFGRFVVVEHAWGESWYCHLLRFDGAVGDTVQRGDGVGLSGSTGNSTGPHLHFSIRLTGYEVTDGWGGYTDPTQYFTTEA